MVEFVKHQVIAMDESMIQRCLYCGEVISDYTNAMWPNNQPPPTGFPIGAVYVGKSGGVTRYVSGEAWQGGDNFRECTKP